MPQSDELHPHDGPMQLSVTGRGLGSVVIKTDPKATGARVIADGSDEMLRHLSVDSAGGNIRVHMDGPAVMSSNGITSDGTNFVSGTTINSVSGSASRRFSGGTFVGHMSVTEDGVFMDGKRLEPDAVSTEEPLNLRVILPPDSGADVKHAGGLKTDFDGNFGKIKAKSAGSSISVQGFFRTATLVTSGGSVNVESVARGSHLTATTSGGNVDVQEFFGDGDLTTSGGDVTVPAANPERSLSVNTSGGDVTVGVVNDPDAMNRVDIDSSGGKVAKSWKGPYTPQFSQQGPIRAYAERTDTKPEPSPRPPSVTPPPAARVVTPPANPQPRARVPQSPPAAQPVPANPHQASPPPTPTPVATADEMKRLARGKQHADTAAHSSDWSALGPVMATAYAHAQMVRLRPTEDQVATFYDTAGQTIDQHIGTDPRRRTQAFVAFALAWSQASSLNDLFQQIRYDPEIANGMAPDIQAVASAGRQASMLPDDVRHLAAHERVVLRKVTPSRWAVDVLPVVNPSVSFTTVHRHVSGTGSSSVDATIAEILRTLEQHPDVAASYHLDNAPGQQELHFRRTDAERAAIAATSDRAYPPILSGGEAAHPAYRRQLSVVIPGDGTQNDYIGTFYLAANVLPDAITTVLYTPNSAMPDAEDQAEQVFGVDVRHIQRAAPTRAETQTVLVNQPAPSTPPTATGQPVWPTAEPTPTPVAANLPMWSRPEPIPAPATTEPPNAARVDRAILHAQLAAERMTASSKVLANYVNQATSSAAYYSTESLSEQLAAYKRLIMGIDKRLPKGEYGAALAAITAGWVKTTPREALLAQVHEAPEAFLTGTPPDLHHIAVMRQAGSELLADVRAIAEHPRAVVNIIGTEQVTVQILSSGQPALQMHTISDTNPNMPTEGDIEQYPSVHSVAIAQGFQLSPADASQATELFAAINAAVADYYPSITAEGKTLTPAPQRHLTIVQSATRNPEETQALIQTATRHVPEPTSATLYTPDGASYRTAGTWQAEFDIPLAYRPNETPTAPETAAFIEQQLARSQAQKTHPVQAAVPAGGPHRPPGSPVFPTDPSRHKPSTFGSIKGTL